jgi:endo-1,4-beta-xylanase
VRDVFEALGFAVDWEQATQTAVLSSGNTLLRITIGENNFTRNGEGLPLDVPAQIIGGRTMLPLRLPLESVGFEVGWDAGRNAVLIGAGETPEPTETREIVFSLATTAHTGILERHGNAAITVENQTVRVTNRTQNWEGINILIAALNLVAGERYSLEITGSAVTPIQGNTLMELSLNGNNWAWLDTFAPVSASNPNFTLNFTFTPESMFDGNPLSSYRYITLQTNAEGANMNFTIENITIAPFASLAPPLAADRLPSIAEAFADYFLVGNIWGGIAAMHRILDQPGAAEHFLHQYNAVTAENHHKPSEILPQRPNFNPDEWNWTNADLIVNWANENNLYMAGHTLIWHAQSNPWLTNVIANGVVTNRPLPRAEAIANMELYINAVAGRYAGRMDSWDVVNEALVSSDASEWNSNPDWRQHIRRGDYVMWYHAFANGARGNECGSDYIYYAYRFARIADSNALLIYNDYYEYGPGKRDTIAHMVEQINARWKNDPLYDNRLLIEAIGLQGHYQLGSTNLSDLRTAIQLYARTGARLHVTELDVRVNDYDTSLNKPVIRLTPAQLQQQADMYKNLFAMFMEFSEYIDRVSFWGTADDHSWLAGGAPLIHTIENGNFTPKPAFWAILELAGITK